MKTAIFLLAFAMTQAPVTDNRAPVKVNPAPQEQPKNPAVDKLFAQVALEGGTAEIRMAELALQRSNAGEVKGFAQKMIVEHKGMAEELGPVAQKVLGSAPGDLAPHDKLVYEHLKGVSQVDFDQQYALSQVAGHLVMLAVFHTEADSGTDQELVQLARKWAPSIQSHLELAVDLTKHVGGSSPFKSN